MVGEAGFEPAWLTPRHFKCLVYTSFTTRPQGYLTADFSSQLLTVSEDVFIARA